MLPPAFNLQNMNMLTGGNPAQARRLLAELLKSSRLDREELLALSPSGELNTLAAMRFRHDFGHQRLFGLASGHESRRSDKHRASLEHRGNQLGSEAFTYAKLASQMGQGAELYSTTLTDGFGWEDYRALHGNRATLLFMREL